MKLFKSIQTGLAVSLVALVAPSAWAAAEAQLLTYQSEGGPTYFAYSMTPGADQAVERPSDVVILFDTSASQTGAYRETAFAALDSALDKLRAGDRVAIVAADLDARPISDKLLKAHSPELQAAVAKLRGELPLGSTDMELVLGSAANQFEQGAPTNRTVLYIGDGVSTANLLGTAAFGELIEKLRGERISVSSYAIGPRTDAALLAAIANQTGGNLYVDEDMALADDAAGVTVERANQENLRRGAKIGETLAGWTQATVIWPSEVKLPAELGELLPKQLPPLRTDRDTLVFGATEKPLAAPVSIEIVADVAGQAKNLSWSATPEASSDNYAYLPQVVESARADDGLTTPTIGLAGLAETGRVLENGLEQMNELAKRAVATGDLAGADSMSQAVLRSDPGNIQAKTVQRVVQRQAAPATAAVADADHSGDLSLVRTAQLPTPPQVATVDEEVVVSEPAPYDGALVDQFDENGALLDDVEQQRRVFSQLLRREVENAVIDARRIMANEPDAAGQQLKLTLQNVERAPELNPDMRSQLIDKLQIALREVQRQASIKDELDAAREEQLAAARERELINQRLARDIERTKQLVGRFNALVDEHRYDEAVDVADILYDPTGHSVVTMYRSIPESVVATVAERWSQLKRNEYYAELARQARWRGFVDALYTVETSSIPFPDEPPIIYPDRTFWEELTVRRKKFASVDLKAAGGPEQRINDALNSPLKALGFDFTEEPLENVVNFIKTEYDIPIQLDEPSLEDAGLTRDEPVNFNLQNVTLRSALRLMLKQKQLTYIIRDEVMIITTPEEAESELVAKVYPVADLVLPIEVPQTGGGGGGIGGQQGGGQQGGGGGGGFGGGGGGQGGGGGGGLFSVPDEDVPAAADLSLRKQPASASSAKSSRSEKIKPVVSIKIDESLSPQIFWDQTFAQPCDQAAVRQAARDLMKDKKFDQTIAMIEAALRHGQPQPWMYESLGIAMELDGRSKAEIERVVMSATDFATSPDELMYIASYLSRTGHDRRALQLCQQVVKVQPLRREAYALGLRSAQRSDDLAGIEWATVGVLGQAWPKNEAAIEKTAEQLVYATQARLEKEGRAGELADYRARLTAATQRDCVVEVSWTGDADVDFEVEEPSGSVCSLSEPRTAAGGVSLGDAYASDEDSSSPVLSEKYICPQGFAGKYRVRIHRVWGDVTAGKVTVDVFRHFGSDQVEHERQQLELTDKDAMVVFDLDRGQRTEPLEAAQLAGAVERQQRVSQAVLAQQIESGNDPSILASDSDFMRRRRAFGALGAGGAVGYQPIIQTLPEGAQMAAIGVISADRRYVRISTAPTFSTIGDVQTFTFAGQAEELDDANNAGGGN